MSALLARIKAQIGDWSPQPVPVALFGSMAREQGTSSSDVDLLVIRSGSVDAEDPLWATQVKDDLHRAGPQACVRERDTA